jgi:hypothetical protein
MAIEIKFKCDHTDTTLIVSTWQKELVIKTKEVRSTSHQINLNRYEAIKLAKEIRKQISFLED